MFTNCNPFFKINYIFVTLFSELYFFRLKKGGFRRLLRYFMTSIVTNALEVCYNLRYRKPIDIFSPC